MSASLKRNYSLDLKQISYYGILVISYLMLGYVLWIFGFYKAMTYSDQILYLEASEFAIKNQLIGSNFQYQLSPDQGGISLSNPYVVTLSIIFKLFQSQYAPLVLNQIIWIFTSFKIYSSYCNKNKSMFFYTLFFPPQLIFSNLYLKESLIASIFCLSFILIRNDSKIFSTLSFISLVSFYRLGYGVILFLNFLSKKLIKNKITLNNFLKIIFFTILIFLVLIKFAPNKYYDFFLQFSALEPAHRLDGSTAERYMYIGKSITSVKSFIFLLFFGIYDSSPFRFLADPKFSIIVECIAVSLAWTFMFPIVLYQLFKQKIEEKLLLLGTIGSIFFISTFSMMTNFGDCLRYRFTVYPVMLIYSLTFFNDKNKVSPSFYIIIFLWIISQILWIYHYAIKSYIFSI